MNCKFENCWLLLPGRKTLAGDLTVKDGKIAAIEERPGTPDRLILPGLVNAHGHTAMTLVRGLGSGLPLQRWLNEAIFPVEARMTPAEVREGTLWGSMEMLAGGTVLVADMYDFPAACEEAFALAGIQANLNRVGLAFPNGEPKGRLAECVEFVRQAATRGMQHDFCVHSEYLTDEKFCRDLAAANREFQRPVNFHVSETRREHEECIARHGQTPIAYLASTGLLDYGGYAAHCVWCTDDDFRIMAEKGVSLVHNPSSNLKLGSGIARIPTALRLGVNVALGTDGPASNDNLDLFEEMHLASLLPKGYYQDPTCLSAWEVIEMATTGGARALGRPGLGELNVGNEANFAVVDLKRPHLTPCLDLPNLIVNSMHASDVVMTVVGGEIAYDGGRFPRLESAVGENAATSLRTEFLAAVRRLGLCALS